MRKTLFLVPVLACFFTVRSFAQAESQSYTNAAGIKFWPGSVPFNPLSPDDAALEGIASFWDNGFRVTGLYELHGEVSSDAPGIRWYVGPGAHLGAYNGAYVSGHYYQSGDISIGVDGVVGLEYKFQGAPIAV